MPHPSHTPYSSHKQRIQTLMQQIQHTHRQFADAFSNVQQAEIRKSPHNWEKRATNINRIAHEAALSFYKQRESAISALVDELQLPLFLEGNPDAIDRVIDFCDVEVLAFGCGARKEWCLHRLKRLPLTKPQIQRLKQLALAQLTRHERGLRAYARLMIRLADQPFIEEVQQIAAQETDTHAQKKARLMLRIIGNSRSDLPC